LWPTCYFNQYTGLTHLRIDILPIVRDFWFFYSERMIFTQKWRKWVKNYKKSYDHDKMSTKIQKYLLNCISEHTTSSQRQKYHTPSGPTGICDFPKKKCSWLFFVQWPEVQLAFFVHSSYVKREEWLRISKSTKVHLTNFWLPSWFFPTIIRWRTFVKVHIPLSKIYGSWRGVEMKAH
jgi:hypothetical protein